jgi:hypothetical protein
MKGVPTSLVARLSPVSLEPVALDRWTVGSCR